MSSAVGVAFRVGCARRRRRALAVTAAAVLVLAGLVGVGPGVGPAAAVTTVGFALDQDFQGEMGTGPGSVVFDMDVQPDGKILVGGAFTTFGGVAANRVVRLNADGTPDAAFNTVLGTGFDNLVRTVDLQADGKILVGGDFTSVNGQAVGRLVRLNTDGSLDAAFQANVGSGIGDGFVFQTVQQPDGKILVLGQFTLVQGAPQDAVVRLNGDGTPDAAFNTNLAGKFTGAQGQARDAVVLPDGKILFGGTFDTFNGLIRPGIVRLNPDGTLDTTYALVLTGAEQVASFSAMPDGSLFMGGSFTINGTSGVARLTTDGELDVAGTATLGSGITTGVVWSVVPDADDKLYVGGTFTSFSGVASGRLVRLNADGSLDAAFSTNLGAGFNQGVQGIAVQPNGLILAGGAFTAFRGLAASRLVRFGDVHVTVPVADRVDGLGAAVSVPVAASATVSGPFTFSATGLPDGVVIDPVTGVMSGTATAAGVFAVTVQVDQPSSGAGESGSFSWTVVSVDVVSPGDQSSTVGAPVDVLVGATSTDGGLVTFAATGLPAGLSIDPVTGRITGSPTLAGGSTVTVTATHTATGATDAVTFGWVVTAVSVDVTDPGDQAGAVGAGVSVTVVASASAPGALTFTATGLPSGVSIDPATGVISGTATVEGVSTVQVTVTHVASGESGSVSFDWLVVAVVVTSPGDQVDAVGAVVDLPVSATSTDGGVVTWSATGLPAGLGIDPGTGQVTGTATTAGSFTVQVTATHGATGASGTVSFGWLVASVGVTSPGDQASTVGAVVDLPVVAASSDGGPVTFAATGLPAGLVIDPGTGAITGTTTTAGSSAVQVTVTHTASGATGAVSFGWVVTAVSVTVTDPGLQLHAVGAVVSVPVVASASAPGALTFAATGLPAGLVIDPATGVVSGTVTTAGLSTVTVTVTHAASGATGTVSFDWAVVEVVVTSPGDQVDAVGAVVDLGLSATSTDGGAVSWSATGLPTGLGIDPGTGQVTGTATTAESFAVQVSATHLATGAAGATSFTWDVVEVVVTSPGDQVDAVGAVVDLPVVATSTDGGALSWVATNLPAGLSIDSATGEVTGTTSATGSFSVSISVTHVASGASGTAAFAWLVASVDVTSPGDQSTTVGTVVDLLVAASSSDGGPVSYAASGLPAGLSIDPVTGRITGTPTVVGASGVTVTVTHAASGATGAVTFAWAVVAVTVAVTDPGDQLTAVGTGVSLPVAARASAPGAITFTTTGLPAGLVVDPVTGVISGAPTTAGLSTVTVTATHGPSGESGVVVLDWSVVAVAVTSPGDQVDAVGAVVDLPVVATSTDGGALSWSAAGLPAGLAIDAVAGVITGTASTAGSSTVQVTATHTASNATGTVSFAWDVVAVAVTSPGDQVDAVGAVVALQLSATSTDGGAVTWAATDLPTGLSIDPGTGQVTGTATTPGGFAVQVIVTHTASNATGTVSFAWDVVAVAVTSPGDQVDAVGAVVALQLSATSTDGGALSWSATGLPPGLGIDPGTGQVTGTATTPGSFTVQVTATHVATGASGVVSFGWLVASVGVTSPGDQVNAVGAVVDLPVMATSTDGGALSWIATGLPAGLSIDPATGRVTGTAGTAGSSSVTVTVTHTASGATGSVAFVWSVVGVDLVDPGDQNSSVAQAVTLPLVAASTDGGAVSFAASGLPVGLVIDPVTGVVSGSPTTAGASTVQVTVTHTASGATDTVSFTWSVTAVVVTVTGPGDQLDPVGAVVDVAVGASASVPGPVVLTASGLPGGLSIDPVTGGITGTAGVGGVFTVTVTATHTPSGANASVVFAWTVVVVDLPGPGDQTTTVGAAVDLAVPATSTDAGPVTYTATGLPAGLVIDPASGQVTGTPTVVGSTSVTVTATHDATAASDTATFLWTVAEATAAPAVVLIDPGAQATVTGDRVDLHLDARASDGAQLVLAAGGLPPGLVIDPAAGQITGAPTTPGTYVVTVTATHPTGVTATITFTWEVLAATDSPADAAESGTGRPEGLLTRSGTALPAAALAALALIGAGLLLLPARRSRRQPEG